MAGMNNHINIWGISISFLSAALLVLICLSCSEHENSFSVLSPGSGLQPPVSFSSRYSNCLYSGIAKGSYPDSVFTYSFSDSLVVDFSVTANCCPDSSRFSISSIAGSDTLVVAVADTAQNLCRCYCLYMAHAEFKNLAKDHYIIRCTLSNSAGANQVIHQVPVKRAM
jgi:hypothetical protein